MNNYELILCRIKKLLSVKKDADVARAMDISTAALSSFKKAGKFPTDRLVSICQPRGISVDWLLTGQGRMIRTQVVGWRHIPHSSTEALKWVELHFRDKIEKIVIITYDDSLEGNANGFLLDIQGVIFSMEGGQTRSQVTEGSRVAYYEILESIQKKGIPTYKLVLNKDNNNLEVLDLSKTDIPSLMSRPDLHRLDLDEEMLSVRPDYHKRQQEIKRGENFKHNMKEAAFSSTQTLVEADLEPELAELFDLLKQESPEARQLFLRILKNRKVLKADLDELIKLKSSI